MLDVAGMRHRMYFIFQLYRERIFNDERDR